MDTASNPARVPDFFCIGAQKAGTTWLYENLRLHGAFTMPLLKEVDYFNYVYCADQRSWIRPYVQQKFCEHILWLASDPNAIGGSPYDRLSRIRAVTELALHPIDEDWYAKLFALVRPGGLTGDCTPEYSLLPPEGIRHLANLNPNAKLILMLRHPVDRDLSHARMLLLDEKELTDSMIREKAQIPQVYLRSAYPEIIESWEREVGPSRLKIAFYDHIITRPAELLVELAGFLGIESTPADWPRAGSVVHKGREALVSEQTRQEIYDRHRTTIERMAERYPDPCAAWLRESPSQPE